MCARPQLVDSQFGAYLRELMFRKMNDPSFVVPYVLRTSPKKRVKGKVYQYLKGLDGQRKFEPQLDRYWTDQLPFGEALDEMTDEDKNKRLELERIQRSYQDVQTSHPLLLELQKKADEEDENNRDFELEQKARDAREEYLRQKKYRRMMLKEFAEEEQERKNFYEKLKEDRFKHPDGFDVD